MQYYLTPFILAAKYDQYEALQLLLDHDTNTAPNYHIIVQYLLRYVVNPSYRCIKLLLDRGTQLNLISHPILTAMTRNLPSIVKLFIEYGANPNACKTRGLTPLYIASRTGRLEMVKILVEAGADTNKWYNKNTPVTIARYRNHMDVVAYLRTINKNDG